MAGGCGRFCADWPAIREAGDNMNTAVVMLKFDNGIVPQLTTTEKRCMAMTRGWEVFGSQGCVQMKMTCPIPCAFRCRKYHL